MASHLTSIGLYFACTNRVLKREKVCTKKRKEIRAGLQEVGRATKFRSVAPSIFVSLMGKLFHIITYRMFRWILNFWKIRPPL